MPVRKIPRSYRNVTGVSAHKKAVGAAEYESTRKKSLTLGLRLNSTLLSLAKGKVS